MNSPSQSLKNKLATGDRERLLGLLKTAQAELLHLQQTDQRLFGMPFDPDGLVAHLADIDFSERVDAFVARFGRLQDLLGDKLLPAWLKAMEESVGAVLENLDRAERLGLIDGADDWLAVRKLRNLMVHEYLDRAETLHMALYAAHEHVGMLARKGLRQLDVICPGFSADCIETLEEINGEIREAFAHAGGETFTYIPCLNDEDAHISALMELVEENLLGWIS